MREFPIQIPRSTRFASQALAIFTATSAVVIVLEFLEKLGVILPIVESAARLIIGSLLMVILICLTFRKSLPRLATISLSACAFFVIAYLSLTLIKDISYLDELPIVGEQSKWKHTLEKVIVAGWTCGALFLLYILMSSLEQSHELLRHREAQEKLANEELRSTIAELRSAERQIIQQERLAALGQLAGGIAHDLKNALVPVAIFADLLRKEKAEDPREAVKMIVEGTAHASRIVSQLQDFHLGQTAADLGDKELINISDIVQQAVDLTRPRWHDLAHRDGSEIIVELDLGTGCMVWGDPTHLKQLFINLLFNAFEAITESGRVIVRVQIVEKDVLVDVVDSGNGMSAEEQAQCFEPFFTSKLRGSGLGLSVCHGIVSRHGGQMRIHDTSKHGTTVRVILPLAEGAQDSARRKPVSARAKGSRIMYIDDDDSVRHSIARYLECEGYDVDTFADGQSGLKNIALKSYDILLTDLGMPGITGWDVVQHVKSTAPEMIVGVISGWSKSEVSKRFERGHRPDFIIEKTCPPSDLAESIATIIDRQRDTRP